MEKALQGLDQLNGFDLGNLQQPTENTKNTSKDIQTIEANMMVAVAPATPIIPAKPSTPPANAKNIYLSTNTQITTNSKKFVVEGYK